MKTKESGVVKKKTNDQVSAILKKMVNSDFFIMMMLINGALHKILIGEVQGNQIKRLECQNDFIFKN